MGLIDQWLGITEGRLKLEERQQKLKTLAGLLGAPSAEEEMGQNANIDTQNEASKSRDLALTQALQQRKAGVRQDVPVGPLTQPDQAVMDQPAPTPTPTIPHVTPREDIAKRNNITPDALNMTPSEYQNFAAGTGSASKVPTEGWYNPSTHEFSQTQPQNPEGFIPGISSEKAAALASAYGLQGLKNKGAADKQQAATLDPTSVDFYASNLLTSGQLPNMGMGSAAARLQIMNRAAQMAKEQGLGDKALALNKAAYAAGQAELTNVQKNRGAILTFENTANKNLDLAQSLSDEVDRLGSPVIDKWINAGKKSVAGDPDVAALDLAMRTAINEYAKVVTTVTGGGITSDQARSQIERDLNSALSAEQVKAVIGTMKQEMENRRTSYDEQVEQIKSQMMNPGQESATPRSQNPTQQNSGTRIKMKGPDGKVGTVPVNQVGEALRQGYQRLQ